MGADLKHYTLCNEKGGGCKHRAGIFMPSHLVLPNHPKMFPMNHEKSNTTDGWIKKKKKRKRKPFSPSTHQRTGFWVAVDSQMVE